MTTIKITSLLPIRPTFDDVQSLISPLTLVSLTLQTEITGEIVVDETVTQTQANALAESIKTYLLSRLFVMEVSQ